MFNFYEQIKNDEKSDNNNIVGKLKRKRYMRKIKLYKTKKNCYGFYVKNPVYSLSIFGNGKFKRYNKYVKFQSSIS